MNRLLLSFGVQPEIAILAYEGDSYLEDLMEWDSSAIQQEIECQDPDIWAGHGNIVVVTIDYIDEECNLSIGEVEDVTLQEIALFMRTGRWREVKKVSDEEVS